MKTMQRLFIDFEPNEAPVKEIIERVVELIHKGFTSGYEPVWGIENIGNTAKVVNQNGFAVNIDYVLLGNILRKIAENSDKIMSRHAKGLSKILRI